ncbi:MAG: hypothetical protein J5787_07325 [Alphaproteobacteria bacterium]|nr:hypothetical protein [Alphaproteobacteria bacterium]
MKAGFKILLASVCLIVYFCTVVFPFFMKDDFFINGLTWKDSSSFYYALVFYPAFWGYLCVVIRNILKVKSIRIPVYAVCFVVVFLACHAAALIWGDTVLWLMMLTVPLGLIGLLLILMWATKQDLKDRFSLEKDEKPADAFDQNLLNVVCFFLLPCFLIGILVTAAADREEKAGTVVAKEVKKISSRQMLDGCSYFSGLIKTANATVKIKETDPLEEIVKAYQNEFQNKDVYGKVELHQSDRDRGEFYVYNDNIVWLIFTFEKKGDCVPDSQNCFFSLMYGKEPCVQYITAEDQRSASAAKDLTASSNSSK